MIKYKTIQETTDDELMAIYDHSCSLMLQVDRASAELEPEIIGGFSNMHIESINRRHGKIAVELIKRGIYKQHD